MTLLILPAVPLSSYQILCSHAGNTSQVSKADHKTREADDGCLAFSPPSPLFPSPKCPLSQTPAELLLRSLSPAAAAQWVTDQVDQLPRVSGEVWTPGNLTLVWLASNLVCRGLCKQGQLVQSWAEGWRKKNMAGQKSRLLHAPEPSVCPVHRSWRQLHRLSIHKRVVLCPVPWPRATAIMPTRAAVPVEVTYTQDSASWHNADSQVTSYKPPVFRSVGLCRDLMS